MIRKTFYYLLKELNEAYSSMIWIIGFLAIGKSFK